MAELLYGYITTEPPNRPGEPTIYVLLINNRPIAYTTDRVQAERALWKILGDKQAARERELGGSVDKDASQR
jgi:hypothetical protein